ncbi:MAG: hypothetical protein WDW38_005390 [Sanguina aurantia]
MARDNKGGRGGGQRGGRASGSKITTGGARPNVAGGRGGVQKSPVGAGRGAGGGGGGRSNGSNRGGAKGGRGGRGGGGRGGRGSSEPKRNLGDLDADLDAYMLKDAKKGKEHLDSELDSYFKGKKPAKAAEEEEVAAVGAEAAKQAEPAPMDA